MRVFGARRLAAESASRTWTARCMCGWMAKPCLVKEFMFQQHQKTARVLSTWNLPPSAWWTVPWRILDIGDIAHKPGYYPQVLGLEEGGTDTLAGRVARLYVHGESHHEIVFLKETPTVTPTDPCDENSGQICPQVRGPRPKI